MIRQIKFIKNHFYHICNKSISGYGIFKDKNNCSRFLDALYYYNNSFIPKSLSKFLEKNSDFNFPNLLFPREGAYVKFIAYCMMPDHYHILIKILQDNITSKYIGDIENSFTRFFNTKFERKGPLWQSGFRAVRIKNNEQLLHVIRYIHLNPTTSRVCEKPEDWELSSYRKYIGSEKILENILTEISIRTPKAYKKFVDNQIDYQRKLRDIKKLILE